MKRTFINEKKNKIEVKVTKPSGSVMFSIKGPKSIMAGKITPKEAKILKKML